VIRGDLPLAAGLADVWLDLQLSLEIIAAPEAGRPVRRARRLRAGEFGTGAPAEEAGPPADPDEPQAATA
jgi:hypothetical protein